MEILDNDELTIDDAIEFLEARSAVALRVNRSYDFVLLFNIMSWLRELKHKREEDTRECALIIKRENLNNGGPFSYEEWCTCEHCGYRHALFIPRDYCPKCGYKFVRTIHKGDEEDRDAVK